MLFEEGYGKVFGLDDSVIANMTAGITSRSEILANSSITIIAKPVPQDLQELREGGILWGYPHCVQQRAMTQMAIDRKQTLIAFEDMFVWGTKGPLCDLIKKSDIIINGTFQEPNNPIDYVIEEEKLCLKPGCLIIDVSCDEGMGFYFAKPTSFKEPMFKVEM